MQMKHWPFSRWAKWDNCMDIRKCFYRHTANNVFMIAKHKATETQWEWGNYFERMSDFILSSIFQPNITYTVSRNTLFIRNADSSLFVIFTLNGNQVGWPQLSTPINMSTFRSLSTLFAAVILIIISEFDEMNYKHRKSVQCTHTLNGWFWFTPGQPKILSNSQFYWIFWLNINTDY